MNKFLVLLLLLILSTITVSGNVNSHENYLQITDEKGQRSTLTDDKSLNQFNYFWSQKTVLRVVPKISFQWHYQLLIKNNEAISNWVYDPRGYAQQVRFNKQRVIYQFASARAFSSFLDKISSTAS